MNMALKKVLSFALAFSLCGMGAAGCKKPDEKIKESGAVMPTVYTAPEVVHDMDTWANEVVKNGSNNDDAVENGVVICPYYELSVNGTAVPVYTTRCAESAHSFAWADVEGAPETFSLNVKLFTKKKYTSAVVLPEKSGVTVKIEGDLVTAHITAYGNYSFAFSDDGKAPSPKTEPLTLFVAPEQKAEVPEGWKEKTIQPGKHAAEETLFTEENTVYKFAPGFHEVNAIKMPSNSVCYLERGAYLKAYETGDRNSVVEVVDVENVKLTGRGLFDFSALDGGDDKLKHPFTFARSKNVEVSGITSINSNTWTLCFYACENVLIDRNLLFAYRTYSDGIMMSECVNGIGRNNFVRTGDDAIEVKATGWWQTVTNSEKMTSENILYENNAVWTDKGCAYGIVWENDLSFTGVTFRDNSVGFAMPVWNAYNNALDIRLGCNPVAVWENVTFENIEIYECWPAAMVLQITERGGKINNIRFKNITVKRSPKGNRALRVRLMQVGAGDDYSDIVQNVVYENISFLGQQLTEASKDDVKLVDFKPDNDAIRALIKIK